MGAAGPWIDHLWQSTLFGLAVLFILHLAAPLPARTRRLIAWIGLLKFVVPARWFTPLVRALDPRAAEAHWLAPGALHLPVQWLAASAPPHGVAAPHAAAAGGGPLPTLVIIWLGGAVLTLLVSSLNGCRLNRRLIAASRPAPAPITERLAKMAALSGHARTPECRLISAEESPGVAGLFHSIVLVPEDLDQSLEPAELDAVLLHECVHAARRDILLSLAQTVVLSLVWFNPVAWVLSRRIDRETEMSCDECVLARLPNERVYLSGLAKTVRHSLGLLHAGFAPAGSTPMGERLGNLRAFRHRPVPAWVGAAAVAGTTLTAILTGYAGSISSLPPPLPAPVAAGPASGHHGLVLWLVDPPGDDPARDRSPAVLWEVSPAYPSDLRTLGVSGHALVDFTVGADGEVNDATAYGASDPQFADSALTAIRQWKFRPAAQSGRIVPAHLRFYFSFDADNGQVRVIQD